MKRLTILLTVLALIVYLGSVPAFAQRGHGGGRGGGPLAGQPSMGAPPMMPPEPMAHKEKGSVHPREGVPEGSTERRVGHREGNRTADELLMQNSRLSSRLGTLLPSGTNIQNAASGFKDLGQFVAAVHVSHNLNIPFNQLKTKIVGPPQESLGKAIQDLRPGVKAKAEVKKARRQAEEDLRESRS